MSQNLDEIIRMLDNAAYFKNYGFTPSRANGSKATGVCPFCSGKKKKFNLNLDSGLWKCFDCSRSGNQITFYAQRFNVSNGDAIKEIKRFLNIEDEIREHKRLTKVDSTEKRDLTTQVELSKEPNPSSEATKGEEDTKNEAPKDEEYIKHPYERLIELALLTSEDRESLKTKRGFTDEIIDEFRFRSGGDYLRDVINKLKLEYTEDKLLEVKILRNVNGTFLPEKQLLEERVIIPYLDEDGHVYHIRPHKLGLKDIPVEPYCRYLLKDRPRKVVLTEGEFKATALKAWRIPGIGGPGTSTFSDKNFDRLVFMLQEFEVKEVCIVYDSEDKGNPEFPNFKEQLNKRFDTQYWSYFMAMRLHQAGFITTIGWLPVEWRIEGKIDFDGALAQGRTAAEINQVIKQAKSYKDFLSSLDEEGQRVVKKKIAKHFSKKAIKREFNKYLVTVHGPNNQEFDKEISNFVINIKSNFYTGDNVVRNVQLINSYGEVSEIFPIDSSSMAAADAFKKFVLSRGNYVFKGSGADLTNIWEYEFLNNDGELIYMPEQIGWIESHKIWLFGNMVIKNGKIYRPDNEGIIWVEGKGFKPQSFSVGSADVDNSIPCLSEKEINIQEVAERIKHSVGGYEAYISIGWVIATIFSKDIFLKYKCMPILFPHGKRESGKSTFMRWMMMFFGVETEGISVGKTTTSNYIARALSYWSSLGLWFDEYRNEQGVIEKDGLFRSAYNRQLSGKGTATAFQAKGFSVYSVLSISGEELPKDNGLFTRCIPLQISSYKRNREYYEWVNKTSEYFSYLTFDLIKNYDLYKDRIMTNIAELKTTLVKRGITDRTAENWGICAACFDTVVKEDAGFIKWVEASCQEVKRTGEEDHMLNQFWQDINSMISSNILGERYLKVENKKLYVWLQGVYGEWTAYYRKRTGKDPFDIQSIAKYMAEEPYYVPGIARPRLGKVQRRAVAIDLSKANEIIQEIADSLDELGNNHTLIGEEAY